MLRPSIRSFPSRLAARARAWPPRLLGAFIVWQLIFIPLANLLDFFPHRAIRLDELTDLREVPPEMVQAPAAVHALSAVTDRWAQITGQQQMWWLFAPQFPPQATFPAVELRWSDRPAVRLLSSLEPADTTSYFRPVGSDDRLFQYEIHLGLGMVFWNEQTAAAEADVWREHFRNLVRMQWKSMRAYLRWRTNQFAAEHPHLPPPEEAVLLIRIFPTLPPDASFTESIQPTTQPLARWQISADSSDGFLPVEAYDPFERRYLRLPLPLGEGTGGSQP